MLSKMTAQLGRFTIRDTHTWDALEILELFGDAETVRYMGLRQLQNIGEAVELLERYRLSPTRWLAILDGPEFLGIVGLEIRGHQATITLAFKRTKKARGAGREFSKPFLQWVFAHPQIWRVWSYVHYLNLPGQRVTERLGATREGLLRRFEFFPNVSTEPQDCFIYSIVRN